MSKATDNISTSTKIQELESIRGLAALLVVVFHIPQWNEVLSLQIIRNGYLMVELFFVLSGFVICNAYATKISNPKQLLRFQFLRFGRLYPVHLLFLAVLVMIEIAKYFAETRFGIASQTAAPFRESSLVALIQQLFLVQAIGPTGNAATYNGPAWSISVEFYTYLLFGFISLFFANLRKYIYFIIFFIALFLVVTQNTLGFEHLLRCYVGFFLGCIVAYTKERTSLSVPSYVSLAAFIALVLFLSIKTLPKYDFVIFFLTAALIFATISTKGGVVKTILNAKPLIWLGTISYSLYMSHTAITWTANQIIRVIFKKPEVIVNGERVPSLSLPETALACFLVITVILAVSMIVFHFVEQPLRERSRRFAFSKLS
jgi:peptidoglycan/LPS O-acetylase OafA/YrhL